MNSKQRRRLRKQVLPEFTNLIATKRVTGELHSWIDPKRLVEAAAKNPQRIKRVAGYMAKGEYVDQGDLEYRRNVKPMAKGARVRRQDLNNKLMRTTLAAGRTVTGRMAGGPSFMTLPRDPGKSVYGKSATKMVVDDALNKNLDDLQDAYIFATKHVTAQALRASKEISDPRQEDTGGL